jgi:hypothetical protein
MGLVALFYFLRKTLCKKDVLGSQGFQPRSKKNTGKTTRSSSKFVNKKSSSSSPSSHAGSLLMHPHSLEVARKEFVQFAQNFRGFYESLFLACQGNVTSVYREHVLKFWEETIQATKAKYLILTWTTIVQKHCGRNFYRKGTTRWVRDTSVEKEILEEWLKQLFKWGLHRELCGKEPLSELESRSSMENEKLHWILNDVVVEAGEEPVKSLEH